MTPALETVAEFVAGVEWDDVPAGAQRQARLALRDTLGTMLGGAGTTAGRIAAEVATRQPGGALIAGRAATSSAHLAALANAVAASALDFDDGHYKGGAIHPGSVVVPAVLSSVAHASTIEDLLTAQVAGYEVCLRAAHLLWPKHPKDDYHCTGTAATLGAAAAVAKLCGYDADGIGRAIAIAWAHAPMATFQLPMVKESIGWSAATGVYAADLAGAGFMRTDSEYRPPPPDILPPTPFDRAAAHGDPYVWSFGEVFEAGNTYFKPFAACRYTHSAAQGLADVMAEESIKADEIEAIEIGTHAGAVFLSEQQPPTLEHAQYSFPFVLSGIALHGAAGAAEMAEDRLVDHDRLAFCRRVTVRHEPAVDEHYPAHYPSQLTVRLHGGAAVERTCIVAPGDAEAPLTEEHLTAKFLSMAAPVLGNETAGRLAGVLLEDDGIAPAEFVAQLAGGA